MTAILRPPANNLSQAPTRTVGPVFKKHAFGFELVADQISRLEVLLSPRRSALFEQALDFVPINLGLLTGGLQPALGILLQEPQKMTSRQHFLFNRCPLIPVIGVVSSSCKVKKGSLRSRRIDIVMKCLTDVFR